MKQLLLIFIFLAGTLCAQDKLFFANGKVKKGYIVSIGNEYVFYKNNDTSEVQSIKKSELVMIEDVRGVIFHIGTGGNLKSPRISNTVPDLKLNSLGVAPLSFFIGKATLVYERLNKTGKVGVAFPISLTYYPYKEANNVNGAPKDSLSRNEISFFGGVDVNFYIGKHPSRKFYIGPRARFGTYIFPGKVTGYTLQTQLGWRFGNPDGKLQQHLSLGFGLAKILTSSNSVAINNRTLLAWFSINYTIGLRW